MGGRDHFWCKGQTCTQSLFLLALVGPRRAGEMCFVNMLCYSCDNDVNI